MDSATDILRLAAADAVYRCSAACRARALDHRRTAAEQPGNARFWAALAAEAEACAAACDQQRRDE